MRWKLLSGFAGYCGVWFCFSVIGERVLQIQTFTLIMLWGVLAMVAGALVERWLIGPKKRKGGVRGR